MKRFDVTTVISLLKRFWFVPIIAVGIVLYFFYGGQKAPIQTMVVHPGTFIRQVSVSGKVTADQQVDLGFAQSGRIIRVNVAESTRVNRGDLIAEVENADIRASLLQKESALSREQAKLDALKRGVRAEELAVSQSSVRSAEAALESAKQGVVNAIQEAYTKSDSAIHTNFDQLLSNPRSTNPELNITIGDAHLKATVEAGRVTIESLLNNWQKMSSVSTSNDLESAVLAQNNTSAVSDLLAQVGAALAIAIPNSSYPQATIDAYKVSIDAARTTINGATAQITAARKAESAAQTTLDTAQKNLSLLQAGTTPEDIRAQEAAVGAAGADVLSARAQLSKTLIYAPFSGLVTKLDAKVGSTVSPNTPVVSLIGTGIFQVESYVPELNVGLVHINDTAEVEFDAYPGESFTAHVLSIDAGETLRDGVSTYRTVLAFEAKDPRIRSGMTANVRITTEKKENVLSIPQGLVKTEENEQVVYILQGQNKVRRVVTTGALSSVGAIEILSGLEDGDAVIMPST